MLYIIFFYVVIKIFDVKYYYFMYNTEIYFCLSMQSLLVIIKL